MVTKDRDEFFHRVEERYLVNGGEDTLFNIKVANWAKMANSLAAVQLFISPMHPWYSPFLYLPSKLINNV